MNGLLPDNGKLLLAKVSEKRPLLLSILCILSFIMSGIMLLTFGSGIVALFLSESTINGVWAGVMETQPQMGGVDPHSFFRSAGIYSIIAFAFQCVSLWGVIWMWKRRWQGFIIYVLAELLFYAIGSLVNFNGEANGISGALVYILVDLVFIGLYGLNWKYLRNNREDKPIVT